MASRAITVTLIEEQQAPRPAPQLDVRCLSDGSLVITADTYTAALLAGRDEFGSVDDVQQELRGKITDAWYEAGCPR